MANEFKIKNGLIVSGSAEIEQDLTVRGTLTADEYHISITSSSILYESGSTVFGNSSDDNHVFTGSLFVSGNVSASSFSGSFVGNGVGLDVNKIISGSVSASISPNRGLEINTDTTITGSITLALSDDPDPSGLTTQATHLFVSASNNQTGEDLYIRQQDNKVKWKWFEGKLNSGILWGGALSYSGSTIYITRGSGIVIDQRASATSEISPFTHYVNWNDITASCQNITSSLVTYVGIDMSGSLYQQDNYFSVNQYRQTIPLGMFNHTNRSSITSYANNVLTAYDDVNQTANFIQAFGPIKLEGLTLSAQSGNLQLTIGSGQSYIYGGFYQADPNDSSHKITSPVITPQIARVRRDGNGGFIVDNNNAAFYSTVDPSKWDDGTGTLNTLSGGAYAIQRVFFNPFTTRVHVYYGQATYGTKTAAFQSLASDPFSEAPYSSHQYVLVGYIIHKGGTDDLSNTSENQIIQAGLFRNTVGSGGGVGTFASLHDLDDVDILNPNNGDLIRYNSSTNLWEHSKNLPGDYSITGSLTVSGSTILSGSIIPSVNNIYDLGSSTHQFRHLYLSSASLYIDGTKVIGSTAQELQITTDTGQSFKILEAGSDTITLQSADGNITLTSSGGGDVIMDPSSGIIALKGTTTLYSGNKIVSSDGNSIQFGNGIAITGSIVATGTNLISGSSQISFTGLTGLPTGLVSGSDQLNSLGYTTTSSFNTYTSSLNSFTNSFDSAISVSGTTTTLKGNLIVQGTTTQVDSTTVNIGDNIIQLNGTGATNAGLVVRDATSPTLTSGSLLWDTTNDKWIAGVLGSEDDLVLRTATQTLTNKTISGASNTISNIANSSLNYSSISIAGNGVSLGGSISAATILSSTGVWSGSAQLPSGTVSGSSQVLSGTGIWSGSAQLPSGVVSGSVQVDVMSTTNIARLATTGSNTFNGTLSVSTTTADYAATITNVQDSSQGLLVRSTDNDSSLYLLNLQSSTGSTSQTWVDRFSVTKQGYVGINKTSPTSTLDIQSAGANGVVLSSDSNDANNSGRIFMMRTGGEGWCIMNNAANLSFRSNAVPGSTSGNERMKLDSSYNLVLNNGLSVAGATNQAGALRMNSSSAGNSPKLTFGTEDESVAGNKSIYLETYWMILQPHVNEGLRVRFVNGSGSQTETVRFQSTQTTVYTNLLPGSDASYNLGSTTLRWNNLYTTDLHLSNEGKQNIVDGTWGDWTLQEGENDIYMLNNRSGEKFKIKLEKITQ